MSPVEEFMPVISRIHKDGVPRKVIEYLFSHHHASPKTIAYNLNENYVTVLRALERLEKRGIVTRFSRAPRDFYFKLNPDFAAAWIEAQTPKPKEAKAETPACPFETFRKSLGLSRAKFIRAIHTSNFRYDLLRKGLLPSVPKEIAEKLKNLGYVGDPESDYQHFRSTRPEPELEIPQPPPALYHNPIAAFLKERNLTPELIHFYSKPSYVSLHTIHKIARGTAPYCPKPVAHALKKLGYPGNPQLEYEAFYFRKQFKKLIQKPDFLTFAVINFLYKKRQAVSIPTIASYLGIPYQTAESIIRRLRKMRFVRRTTTPGPKNPKYQLSQTFFFILSQMPLDLPQAPENFKDLEIIREKLEMIPRR